MGAVYLGQHTLLGRRAAIKVLLPALSARQDIVTRFFNEARAVTSISDPGIVQVFDFGYHSDGSAFIVMEYLEGEALDQRLAKLRRFPIADALRLCRQVATSLAAAHAQHIIHRDLKPENIFLVRDAEVASGERSKILDFGIAKLSDEETSKVKTHVGALMGTPVYMSPEQCRGLPDIDHRADIYALACVTFHLMAGRPPFDGEGMGDLIAAHITEAPPALSSLVPGVPPSVDALLLRCMAKDPAQRYQTMTELAAAITAVLHQLASEAVPGFVVSLDSAPVGMRTPVPGAPYGHTPAPGTPPPAMMRTPVPQGSVAGMKHTPVPQGTVPGASAGMTHPPPRRALTPVPGAQFTAPTGSPTPAPGAHVTGPPGSPT
ncbi:MAG TPA: protein kinase, partial [Kofleriaceae bacterium]|nr:protein kinase [Kofleriaceae bacterium]